MTQTVTAGIVQRIREYRKLNGWTARQLADETGGSVSRHVIANLESGRKTTLDLEQFIALVLALRVPPAALLVDVAQPFARAPLRFVGSSARPLDDNASNIAFAHWLNGCGGVATTAAAARVANTSAAVDEYLDAADEDAVARAAGRLGARHEPQSGNRLRNARARLHELNLAAPRPPA